MQDYCFDHAVLLVKSAKKIAVQEECSVDLALKALQTAISLDVATTSGGESIVEILEEISRHLHSLENLAEIARNLQGIDYELTIGFKRIAGEIERLVETA